MISPSLTLTACDFDHWISQSWSTDRRYYQADIMQDLFGTWVIKRSWGGLGSRRRTSMTQATQSYSHALDLLEQVTRHRQKRTCDYCGKGIPVGEWWTSKGRPRLHCSLECRQAANSRKMENRAEWMRERIECGDWVNPATINKPTSETISKNSRAARLREVEEGRWRNPGSTPEARAKNSEPHKHTGLLASAIEKMGHGVKLKELPEDEREAYHVYARQLRSARKDEINQQYRERYRRAWAAMTEEEKETQREKWRQQNRKRAQKKQK